MINKIVISCSFLFLLGCNSKENRRLDCIPQITINAESPFYTDFAPGTVKTINGIGIKGIFLYKNSFGKVRAYDRQAPHLCPTAPCALLQLDGILVTSCDVSFSLEDGQPFGTDRGLIQYNVFENNGTIIISN